MAIMKNARRIWNDNSEFIGKADAEKVQDEINMVASTDPNGKCTNKALVDFARNHPHSETHKCFDWNDATAAEKYRLHQAARIKCDIITVTCNPNAQTQRQHPISIVTNHSLPTPGSGHKDIVTILKNKNDTAALDVEMYENFKTYAANFEKRFMFAPSSASLIQQLKAIASTLP